MKRNLPDHLEWTDAADDAFNTLKQALVSQPIPQLPELYAPFILMGASQNGTGAVLMQPSKKDPCSYVPVAELNYSVVEMKVLAFYWALQKFALYLYGKEFRIQTDHRPLVYLQQADTLNPRLKKWALCISLYKFTAQHIKGAGNNLADFLFRP